MASRIGPSNFFLTFSGGFPNIGKPEVLRVASTYSARKQKLNINASAGGTTPTPESELSWPRQDLDFPDKFAIEYEQKIEEIRQVLQSKGEDDACECLVLVDAIQRVGLSSYYKQEIETILRKLYVSSCSCMYGYYNLHDVSLFFRLLRQHGNCISAEPVATTEVGLLVSGDGGRPTQPGRPSSPSPSRATAVAHGSEGDAVALTRSGRRRRPDLGRGGGGVGWGLAVALTDLGDSGRPYLGKGRGWGGFPRCSTDVFNNFKGKDGRFRRNFSQDIRGLVELYEAAQLSAEGEHILDEAASFSSHLLRECLPEMDSDLSIMITGKLRHPYHKTVARLTRKDFLQDFERINGWGKTLRELAVMDLRKGICVPKELASFQERVAEKFLDRSTSRHSEKLLI
ncbi:UNVERIFIED_CONTAM: Tricyclene synthase Oc15, chloroplastic [Sesamum angustifolium]|uniref:Tricyclene synthase Oc15, chloroplastic n=1 Tax=Sesamum angustifolium TaxID=2727405 RepID=A0AAW2PF10_9LAMI